MANLGELKLKGSEIAVHKTAVEAKPSVLKKLSTTYEENARFVFLFDYSGSMGSQIGSGYTVQYAWPAEKLAEIRAALISAAATLNNTDPMDLIVGAADPNAMAVRGMLEVDPNGQWTVNVNLTDEEIKVAVVRNNLTDHFEVMPDLAKRQDKIPTRLEVVKRLVRGEIEKRLAKYPDAQIGVIAFNDHATVEYDSAALAGVSADVNRLWAVLDQLFTSGGTDILGALKQGVEICRKDPSAVGLHRFILVSDGEDHVADMNIAGWVPALKSSGIVIDYVHIGDTNPNGGLMAACKALGGECVTVNSERDLEEKFIEVVNRLCLPPASTK